MRFASRRDLPIDLRDSHGLNALHRVQVKLIAKELCLVKLLFHKAVAFVNRSQLMTKLRLYRRRLVKLLIYTLKAGDHPVKKHNDRNRQNISKLENSGINFSEEFRFQNGNQLREILRCFQFPTTDIRIKASKFSAEEVLLISLKRLSFPNRWCEVQKIFPNRSRSELCNAFYWFLDYMIINWGYLILNNREYWLGALPLSAEAVRLKLSALPKEANRLYFGPADDPLGFNISLFIDNTLMAMSRPGGGPMHGGENAERMTRFLQQAFWTGWKKLHGLKWQTVVMANGMDFEVWGPASVRRNDNFTLHRSHIEEKLEQLQEGQALKYKIHGDSAYSVSEWIVSGGGKGMAAVRETIEWSYKDLKTLWAYCNYKQCLKLLKQPLAKIFFVCMLLRNVHVTLNGCQTCEYFNMLPPTLQDWTKNGPQFRPIPQDVFN